MFVSPAWTGGGVEDTVVLQAIACREEREKRRTSEIMVDWKSRESDVRKAYKKTYK
jgi:hypothetical protein